MAELSVLYSTALFELALESGVIDEIYEQAILMRDVLGEPECNKVLIHPHIKNADKNEFFKNAFGSGVHEYLINLLRLAIEKNRESYIVRALTALIARIDRYSGRIRAEVLSACKMSAEQAAQIKRILSDKLDKNVEIEEKVVPNLIGGPFIRIDGYILDQTVIKRLREMSANMKEGWCV